MTALLLAQKLGDIPSVVRWTTFFGHGLSQFARHEEAVSQYDRALKIADGVPELSFPVMTYLGKGAALSKLGRRLAAESILRQALADAEEKSAFGYQANIRARLAQLNAESGNRSAAMDELHTALDLAKRAGGRRLLAYSGFQLAKLQQAGGQVARAAATSDAAIREARAINDQMLLPRLLAYRAELALQQRQPTLAVDSVDEAADILEGLIAGVTSSWLQARLIGAMNDVYASAIHVHGRARSSPDRFFATVERARGRALANLLASKRSTEKTVAQRTAARELSRLQLQLFRSRSKTQRAVLLDRIFQKEVDLTPALIDGDSTFARKPVSLAALRARLRADEVLLEFASSQSESYCLIVSTVSVRVKRIAPFDSEAIGLAKAIQEAAPIAGPAEALGKAVLDQPEIQRARRIIVVPDGALHSVPFEVFTKNGRRLLETHIVSYVPSGSALAALRSRMASSSANILAVASSPSGTITGPVARGLYDVEPGNLLPLPSALDEARFVAQSAGAREANVLVPPEATEARLKSLKLTDVGILHFAVHGVTSAKFPERSALILEPGSPEEDGLLQAREILDLRLNANLVTLSACETGAGRTFGQEGVASLVRPFLAVGARAVVANLWAADDSFSFALMKEFYRRLASGADKGEALRQAKLKLIAEFRDEATPKLWSGVVIFGDATGSPLARRAK
ncbi:MAG: CHAT domain-containing protein [Bryobacteraceae bacterium]|nr:CHAT domain-containing protein [Bryobacteraceae bacterium]